MNREQLTLAFGITLVLAVVIVSIRQNLPSRSEPEPASETAPAAPARAPEGTPPPAPAPRPASPSQDPGPTRIDASVGVAHKHRFGSCEGTLRATASGLTYATTNREDAFRLPFGDVDQFDLDADRKNLRVRERGGRTWNFSARGDNAAPLAAFYREVERARRVK